MSKRYLSLILIYGVGIVYIIWMLILVFQSQDQSCSKLSLSEVYRHITNKNFSQAADFFLCIQHLHSNSTFFTINYILLYITLQSLSIPGSIILNFLAGILYGFYPGFIIISICTSVGTSLIYIVSKTYGVSVFKPIIPHSLSAHFEPEVKHLSLKSFIVTVCLRLSPVPNWSINLLAPHLPLNLMSFVIGTIVGLTPAMYVQITAGMAAMKLTTNPGSTSLYSVIVPIVSVLVIMWICSHYVTKHFVPQEITDVLKRHSLNSIFI